MSLFSFFTNLRLKLKQWWCGRRGHGLLSREWEWSASTPSWRECEEWSCRLCDANMGLNPPDNYVRVETRRPVVESGVWEIIEEIQALPDAPIDIRFRMQGDIL